MGYKFWSEKCSEGLPQYSRLPQQDDINESPISREQLQGDSSSRSNIFQYIRFFFYSVTGVAFIISIFCAGPDALHSYLNAPSSTSLIITNSSAPTINLIIATSALKDDSTAWTKDIQTGNLAVIKYNPPALSSQGSEALIYLNHIYEFYDNLPSISIFSNGWDKTKLPLSETELINQLNLSAVQSHGFLPFCFQDRSPVEMNDSMISSFHKNFPNDRTPHKLPAPCTKFAVSRDAIRSIPREQYLLHASLLEACDTPGAGKNWDAMWQYLFLRGDTTEVVHS
ncbi:hypothetical protein EYC80_000701 [Monilinia laxa]|uniref:Uncharacterized protein n=1 Tax=Monilinia laxa TaxID=61186 RepID=A0A5N6KBP3_MONLA|nr:hypothetical protein EYC80_000701 [Monilinia laxa]